MKKVENKNFSSFLKMQYFTSKFVEVKYCLVIAVMINSDYLIFNKMNNKIQVSASK